MSAPSDQARPHGSHSGAIRFEVDKASSLDYDGRSSPEVIAGGLPVHVNVYKDDAGILVCFASLHCQLSTWSVDAVAECTIFNSDSSKNIVAQPREDLNFKQFNDEIKGCIFACCLTEELMRLEQGFVTDDKISVEVRFTLSNMKGLRIYPQIDFTDPAQPYHDVALIIEGEKVYASKQILAVHSPVFNAMFYSNFDEKSKNEIELKDVNRKEFLEMLGVIYPLCRHVEDDTAEYLLRLGDRFQMTCVVDKAEKHLSRSDDIPISEKIRIADKFSLYGLMNDCLEVLKSAEDFKKVQSSPVYDTLSVGTVKALFDKMLKTTKC